jgi:hypothetical protein
MRTGNPVILKGDSLPFNIYIFSKDGPGYSNVPSQCIAYEHIGTNPHIDTFQFILSSPYFCCQVRGINFPREDTFTFINVPHGQTVDTAFTILYTPFVKSFSFDTVPYPFSMSVEDQPSKKIVHIRCHQSLADSTLFGILYLNISINYWIKLFDGDSLNDYLGLYTTWGFTDASGVKSQSVLSNLKITPNPASKLITVSLGDNQGSYEIAIFSSSGNLVKTLSINSFPFQINVGGLSSGTYYLQARGKQRTYYQKFIVE